MNGNPLVIYAALITATVSYLVALISKENNISQNRQSWINDLRSEIAKFKYSIQAIEDFNKEDKEDKEDKKYLRELYRDRDTNYNLINTRLTGKDNIGQELKSNITKVFNDSKYKIKQDHLSIEVMNYNVDFLLKLEWERVKIGEPMFIIIKFIFLLIISLGSTYTFNSLISKMLEKIHNVIFTSIQMELDYSLTIPLFTLAFMLMILTFREFYCTKLQPMNYYQISENQKSGSKEIVFVKNITLGVLKFSRLVKIK